MLRLNDPQGDPIGDASVVQGLRRLVEGIGPGRYHVEEIAARSTPLGPHVATLGIRDQASGRPG